MAAPTKHPLATWAPIVVACVFGCATETQGDGLLLNPVGDGGSGGAASAGTSSTDGGSAAGSMTAAGTFSEGGTTSTGGGGSSSAGTFTSGGFSFGGTFSTAGTDAGGTGGTSGGAGGASGGKGGSGGAGGSAAGSGGKGGTGGTGGTGGGSGGTGAGGTCKSVKLTPLAASDAGNYEYAPSQAIDGDVGTRWSSEHMVDTGYLQLDMGQAVLINHVNIVWEAAYATDYKLQVADAANGPYTDIYENKAGAGGTEDIQAPPIVPKAGRYFRMQGVTRKTQYGYSIKEIVVYGDTDPSCK